jgi:ubiquinone biosynthesis protein
LNFQGVLLRGENIVNQVEGMAENGFELSESAMPKIGEAQARGACLGHIALWLVAAIGLLLLLRGVRQTTNTLAGGRIILQRGAPE